MTILVCPVRHVETVHAAHAPSRAIGLLSPGWDAPIPLPETLPQLNLRFHDIAEPREGLTPPDEDIVSRILRFGADQESDPLLIYCWAGISRSTAAAYALACQRFPDKAESELAIELRLLSPSATPNPLIVRLADLLLRRDGRMSASIAAIGRGAEAAEGVQIVWKF